MSPRFLIATALVPLVLAACGGQQPESTPQPVADVDVQRARTRDFSEVLTAYGSPEYSPAHARAVVIQADAAVLQVPVMAGALVQKGEVLLRMAPSEITRLDFGKAERESEVAAADLKRQERLRDQGLATNSDVDSARAAAANAKQLRDSLAARIRVEATVRAPLAGVIDGLTAQPGDLLTAGTSVLRINDVNSIQVRLAIEPDDVPKVRSGQTVELWDLATGRSRGESSVMEVDRRVDPQARVAAALVALPADSNWPAGVALGAQIHLATHAGAVAVPRSAVLFKGDRTYVFVLKDGKAHRTEVRTGLRDERDVEIVEGLAAGNPVITRGNYELDEGMRVRTASTATGTPPR